MHSICSCVVPSQPDANHRCGCGKLHPDSLAWAIKGSESGWIGPFLAILKARAA